MKPIILLQVRSSSKRLPYKCFLLIKEIHAIIYLYNRIKSKKYNLSILTSNHKSDDYLAYILKKKKINFFRGNLNNVKERFLEFLKNKKYKTIVRITADNLFIDSTLIQSTLKKFKISNKNYMYINHKKSNLPYGISVEIFDKKILEKSKSKTSYDNEHVTSYLNKENLHFKLDKFFKFKMYNLRCTLDYLSDYIHIKKVINDKKPTISWIKLCKNLKKFKIEKSELKFKIRYTHEISKTDLNKIVSLKQSFWEYSLESQKAHFYKNYKKRDKHILLFKKNILIGYNCLKNICLEKFKYLLLDSFVVKDFYRGKGISNILLSKSMNEILNENKVAYLLANKNSYKLYLNFGWKIKNRKFLKKNDEGLISMEFKK